MNQPSPLLNYRMKSEYQPHDSIDKIEYNMETGLWEEKDGTPFIKRYIENREAERHGETMLTKTREGIDQSEVSLCHSIENDNVWRGETLVTHTRESVDRSETSV